MSMMGQTNPGGIDIQALLAALKGRQGGVASGGRTNPMEAMQQRILDVVGAQGQGGGMMPPGGLGEPAPGEMQNAPAPADQNMMDLQGMPDPRGMEGMLSRGANVYPAGNAAQQGGGQQYGPPVGNQNALGGMGGGPGVNPMQAMLPQRDAILRRIQAQRGNHGLLA